MRTSASDTRTFCTTWVGRRFREKGGASSSWAVTPLADGSDGFSVVDVSDPAAPRVVGNFDTPAYGVAVAGRYACVTDDVGLHVVDVSDPASPRIVGSAETAGLAGAVAHSGHYAYVGIDRPTPGGLQVVDISDPTAPAVVGSVEISGHADDIAVDGTHAYIVKASELHIVDISDPFSPRSVAEILTSADWV